MIIFFIKYHLIDTVAIFTEKYYEAGALINLW